MMKQAYLDTETELGAQFHCVTSPNLILTVVCIFLSVIVDRANMAEWNAFYRNEEEDEEQEEDEQTDGESLLMASDELLVIPGYWCHVVIPTFTEER